MDNLIEPEIRRLSSEVCNQIAAGEVVERPASVVKELVENALDAGADQIKVVITEGGKDLIEVTDNGHGMSADQAQLALERHATSKIVSAADLFGVSSYGFRGEALPSIASVSDFSLTTRTRSMDAGIKLTVSAAGEISAAAAPAPVGTKVVVKDLFYLVPARKNFLKTTNTERGAILDRLQRFAMSHPECSFLLEHNGRRLLNFTRGDREVDRIAAVLKLKSDDQLRPLPESGGDEIKLKGYVSLPTVQMSSGRHIYFFVNRRAVRDKALLAALLKAYEGTLPRGRYPAAVLFLKVADGAVDVNVHPAKEEVRFADGGRLFGLIRQVVAEALSGYPVNGKADDFFSRFGGAQFEKDDAPLYSPAESSPVVSSLAAGSIAESRLREEGVLPSAFYDRPADIESENYAGTNLRSDSGLIRDDLQAAGARWRSAPAKNRSELNSFTTAETLPGMDIEAPGFFASMTLIGVLWNSYIILQADDECYMLDQHAAHERVLFETLKKNRSGAGPAQRLLLPVQVECSAAEESLAEVNCDRLKHLGFEFSSLGPGTLLLQTTPLLVDGLELEKVFLETLADLESGGRGEKLASIDALLAPLACRMAVKANRFLTSEEIYSLLKKLDRTPMAHTCPHGRPLYFKISKSEIEKHVQR